MTTNTTMNVCGTLGPYGSAVTSLRCSRRASRRASTAYQMLPSGRAMPSAGRIRPYTVSDGMPTTARHRPVSTMTLSSTFVPRPNSPFQSPLVHHFTVA